jgi:leucyl aminopeptidase
VHVRLDSGAPEASPADLLCVGLFEGDELPAWLADSPGAGDASTGFKKLTMLRPAPERRVLVVGLGAAADFDAERARVAASFGVTQARRYEAGTLAWEVPGDGGASIAAAIAGGTILSAYRFDRFKTGTGDEEEETERAPGPSELVLHGVADAEDAAEIVEVASVAATAANRARDLQNLPANIADPAFLAERAAEIAATSEALSVELLGPAEMEELGMGGMLAVAAGSAKDPVLIVLRYAGDPGGETLAIVGKAVTFDTGGISLKPAATMYEMKMDMSGGATALEATAAIAELEVPINLLTVVPSVENMPGGRATRPGDVITQMNGMTVEVNNTDAEGRLILADALTWAARQGAERMVDLATLTGAVVSALGSTHAAVIGTDDELVERIGAVGSLVGELTWRLPLHPEYRQLMAGTIADLTNSAPKRKAGTITAAEFLREFVEDAGWAHLDIAGTSWDVGRPYVGRGPSGYGVRLLVELARSIAAARDDSAGER